MRQVESTITINKPAKVVWDFLNNTKNMSKWLEGFQRYEHVSGEPGQPGSRGKQYYNEKGREFVMDEEILEVTPNKHIKLSLTSKQFDMVVENNLRAVDADTTELTASNDFTRLSLMMKVLMPLFMPSKKAKAQHTEQMAKIKKLIEQA